MVALRVLLPVRRHRSPARPPRSGAAAHRRGRRLRRRLRTALAGRRPDRLRGAGQPRAARAGAAAGPLPGRADGARHRVQPERRRPDPGIRDGRVRRPADAGERAADRVRVRRRGGRALRVPAGTARLAAAGRTALAGAARPAARGQPRPRVRAVHHTRLVQAGRTDQGQRVRGGRRPTGGVPGAGTDPRRPLCGGDAEPPRRAGHVAGCAVLGAATRRHLGAAATDPPGQRRAGRHRRRCYERGVYEAWAPLGELADHHIADILYNL
jgi:hypothetical protein